MTLFEFLEVQPPEIAFKGLRAAHQGGHILISIPEQEVFATLPEAKALELYADPKLRALFFEMVVTTIATASHTSGGIEAGELALRQFIRAMAQEADSVIGEIERAGCLEAFIGRFLEKRGEG